MSKLRNDRDKFEKYLKQELGEEESHQFEREVLRDDFEQEALEGLESLDPQTAIDDIKSLQARVAKRKSGFGWLRIAAVVSLLAIGTFSVWLLSNKLDEPDLVAQEVNTASTEETKAAETTTDDRVDASIEESTPIEIDADEELVEAESYFALEEPQSAASEASNELAEASIEQIAAKEEVESETASDLAFGGPIAGEAQGASVDLPFEADEEDLAVPEVSITQERAIEVTPQPAQARSARVTEAANLADETFSKSRASRKVSGFANLTEERMVRGTVQDDAGNLLPGVTVTIKGTTTGTTTDSNGKFALKARPSEELVISYIGYQQVEMLVGEDSTKDITLTGQLMELSEVVVTGAGEGSTTTAARPAEGNRSYKRYLEDNLQYPAEAIANSIEGTVTLLVEISSTGSLGNISVVKSLGYGCDEEAIRLVREGPIWAPAIRNGIPAEDEIRIKVKFKR